VKLAGADRALVGCADVIAVPAKKTATIDKAAIVVARPGFVVAFAAKFPLAGNMSYLL